MTNQATDATAATEEPERLTLDRRRLLHAFDWGVLTAAGVAVAYGVLLQLLDWGMIAVAVVGGWLIGRATNRGAWRDAAHWPSRALSLLAAVLGLFAWLGGFFVAYLLSRALLDSDLSFVDRLADFPFLAYLAARYDLAQGAALLAMIVMGWRSAR
ncbi:MAG: hypothetical protein M3253_01410 [Chloroflexota bacterium]|nr:hypothetical protein [Chloroflexota bacterium]